MRLEAPSRAERTCAGDAVEAWLRILRSLLHMPESQASNICDELEMHLRERIRDLQVSGTSESDATRIAIGELGDAAVLAGRYRSATRWRYRRLSMNIAFAIVAGTAALLSVVAVSRTSQTTPPEQASAQLQTGGEAQQSPDDLQARLLALEHVQSESELHIRPRLEQTDDDLAETMRPMLQALMFEACADEEPAPSVGEFETEEIKLGNLLDRLAQRLEMPLRVRWPRLEQTGILRETPVVILGDDLDLQRVFEQINDGLSDFATLAYRTDRNILEIADRDFFDRRELRLVTYDIGSVLAANQERFDHSREDVLEELLTTLYQFVSPYDWVDNGGDLASQTVVGDRLFVEAPPRMHRQIRWILEQLVAAAAGPDGHARARSTLILKRYVLKHVDAAGALEMLRTLDADFNLNRFTLDARSNTLLGIATEIDHQTVRGALAALDRAGR